MIQIIPENIKHSFCSAKWLMVTMHFGMGENHSCYHPPIHKWNLEDVKKDPSFLHNTTHKMDQRRMMLEGVRPEECNYCFNIEDIDPNVISDRKRFSTETWALERNDKIINSSYDEHISPAYMEISFANTCNFACSYCSPGQSSTWEHEIRKYGSYPVEDTTVHKDKMHDMLLENDNPYIDAFWQWLPKIYKDLRYLRITGGEPLATRNFIKLLDFIAVNENKDLTLVVNSNLCVPEKNLQLFFSKARTLIDSKNIKGLEVYTSMDTWGDHAEYIRDGLDIKRWEDTVRKVSKEFSVPIRIMVTFGLLSIFKFDEFINKVIELRDSNIDIQFNCARLTNPRHFDLRILPNTVDKYFIKVNEIIISNPKIMKVELETWNMVYKFWESRNISMTEEDRSWCKKEFQLFTLEYDKRRKKDFKQTFDILKDWI